VQAINDRSGLEARLIVTGMHLLKKFGRTVDQIRKDGWNVDATVKMQTGRDSAAEEPAALARGISGIAREVDKLKCDIVLVLGDRIEAFAGACAAAVGRRVLAHIHGGDRAVGDVDDSLRNVISRLAHIHLVASQDASDRLKKMGEMPGRIYRVGAPGLDNIRRLMQMEKKFPRQRRSWLQDRLGSITERAYAVVLQHPCGLGTDKETITMRRIVQAVEKCGLNGVAIYPNSDPGHDGIIREINLLNARKNWRVFKSLPRDDYLRIVHSAAVLVGNSSSGIIESASLGVNAVNIGPRQAGRLKCGPGVIDVQQNPQAIVRGIRKALKMPPPKSGKSVYGDGKSSPKIAKILEGLIITPGLLRKKFSY